MAERPLNPQDIQWRDLFLFTRIFRAFRLAIRPSKMLLALTAILLMYAGGRTLDAFWPQDAVDRGYVVRTGFPVVPGVVHAPFASLLQAQLTNFSTITSRVLDMSWGYPSGVPKAVGDFAVGTPIEFWRGNKVFFTLLYGWFLAVWALCGGALCRIAAVHVARDEVISPVRAMRFSFHAMPSFVAAPLIPLLMVVGVGVIISVLGSVLYIPYAGPILGGLLLIVPLILGIVMTILVIGAVAGSGLMYPTIAVEGSDAFDAVSRALSHVFAAPWRLLFYTAVAVVYGTLTYFFVRLCAYVVLVMVNFFMGWFVTGGSLETYQAMWPTPGFDRLAFPPQWSSLDVPAKVGAGVISFWIYLVIATVGAYVISFYFCASTIIYMLMRLKVDATELSAVYLEPVEEDLPEAPALPAE